MTELLTAAQMKAIETAAIVSGAVTGRELMERAGRGVVEAVFETWPALAAAPHRAVVLCGPGNNGGDGFVIARLLKEWGWKVDVCLYGDADRLPPDAGANCARWADMGAVGTMDGAPHACRAADLVVDALFGTGLTRPLGDDLAGPVGAVRGAGRIVAVDIPSGLCADSGRVIGGPDAPHVAADLTVTFHRAKLGHYLAEGPATCGSLVVKPIGL
jgi:hydroxyethylthiazole kinase-like uncharacterized protein yjeF